MTASLRYEGPDGRIHNIREAVAAATKGAATVDPTKVNIGPPTYNNLITMSKKDLKALLIRVRSLGPHNPLFCVFYCASIPPRRLQCLENQIAVVKQSDPQIHGQSLLGELNDFCKAVSAMRDL